MADNLPRPTRFLETRANDLALQTLVMAPSLNDEFCDHGLGCRPPHTRLVAGIVFLTNQRSMPAQQSLWRNDIRNLLQASPPQPRRFDRQALSLTVGETRPLLQQFFERSNFLLQVFDYQLLFSIHHTRQAHEQKIQRIHPGILINPADMTDSEQCARMRQKTAQIRANIKFSTLQSSFRYANGSRSTISGDHTSRMKATTTCLNWLSRE